jgi:OOP family OmpA-OmpF porin
MSLLTDLFSTFEKFNLGELAGALGQSNESLSRGMQTAMGTVLGGIASKSGSPDFLQKILGMGSLGAGDLGETNLASAVTDPNSPLISVGKAILSSLFGGSEGKITQAVGAQTGLPHSMTSSLLAIAAPMVVNFLGHRAQAGGMSPAGLGSLLQRELPAIRSALPPSIGNLLGPLQDEPATAVLTAAQGATQGSTLGRWVLPLLLAALIPAIWLFHHAQRRAPQPPPIETGTANRAISRLEIPFQPGSMDLQPDAEGQLRDFAGAVATNPNARIMVSGFTDSSGSEAANVRLSQQRADAVKAGLIRMGIPEDRITSKGFGEQNPIGNNDTLGGRVANNRVSVEISEY